MAALGSCKVLIVCGDVKLTRRLEEWGESNYRSCVVIKDMDEARGFLRWTRFNLMIIDLSLPRSLDDFIANQKLQNSLQSRWKESSLSVTELELDDPEYIDLLAKVARNLDYQGGLTLLKELQHGAIGLNFATPAIILMGQPKDLPTRKMATPYPNSIRDVPLIFLDESQAMEGVWKVINFDWVFKPLNLEELNAKSYNLVRNM